MLEAGGNPNARNEFGEPIILMNWYLGYYPNQARSRLELLLDRGADVNSAMSESASDSAGYTLLLYRTKMGLDDNLAYADALTLIERGADPNRAAAADSVPGALRANAAHAAGVRGPLGLGRETWHGPLIVTPDGIRFAEVELGRI
jgi:hypothetical protein